jgi:hypothetical protein
MLPGRLADAFGGGPARGHNRLATMLGRWQSQECIHGLAVNGFVGKEQIGEPTQFASVRARSASSSAVICWLATPTTGQ